ncbi:ER membrane protein complex subunit 8/9 homolog [Teleopsis dalmanni]|uniref:ER membrane protein complex subunit 8/9 homolog n=1 Tax=Teleopsis dalmanni TaxID=139649 RepID=UPI0018CFB83A|nr:ER membrane protein complex subunit 8/9 homolog [Teleopsis dalmanni]
MTEYKFSDRAYTKMIFHAAKYPHLAINGVLLAEKGAKSNSVVIVDAIPLFHQCLYVTPMVEIALMQVDAYAERENLVIAGYYAACENFYDNTLDKVPAAKIADKIQENFKGACFAIIDNKLVTLEQEEVALKVFSCNDGGRWSKSNYSLQNSKSTLEAVSVLLKRGAMKDVVDFDNHLDNPKHDWTNELLNKDLKQIMAMY